MDYSFDATLSVLIHHANIIKSPPTSSNPHQHLSIPSSRSFAQYTPRIALNHSKTSLGVTSVRC